MKNIKVKNINGTSKDRYTITNLKEKYISAGGVKARVCQVVSCSNKVSATAHVHSGGSWLLAPTCAMHNHHTNDKPMTIAKSALVPVKKVHSIASIPKKTTTTTTTIKTVKTMKTISKKR